MEYEKCTFCGGKVDDAKPHYIPIGQDSVLKIIDQQCTICGAVIIGPHQKTEMFKNQKIHDKLYEFYNEFYSKLH